MPRVTIWDMALFEALKDKPQCNELAQQVLIGLNVIGHDRTISEVGYGRVKYETIRNYHEDFRIKIPLQIFIRLVQFADCEWLGTTERKK